MVVVVELDRLLQLILIVGETVVAAERDGRPTDDDEEEDSKAPRDSQ